MSLTMSTAASTSRRAARSMLLTGAAMLLAVSVPVDAATRTPYGSNIVKNPSAEAGAASPDGTTTVDVPGWEFPIQATVVAYGTAGFPSVGEGNSYGGGDQFFYSGPDNGGSCDGLIQDIRIKGRAAAIDGGHVRAKIRARIGTDSSDDAARVMVSYFDGNNHQVTTPNSAPTVLGPVTSTDRQMLLRKKSKTLPRKTRILRLRLLTTSSADDCAGYFDKVAIVLTYVP